MKSLKASGNKNRRECLSNLGSINLASSISASLNGELPLLRPSERAILDSKSLQELSRIVCPNQPRWLRLSPIGNSLFVVLDIVRTKQGEHDCYESEGIRSGRD